MENSSSLDSPLDSAPGSGDLNARQERLRDFAVRKSCTVTFNAESNYLVIRRMGDYDATGRHLAVYRSGVTLTGAKVALIDVSLPRTQQLRWIAYKQAWSLIAEGAL